MKPSEPILALSSVSADIGRSRILRAASLQVAQGERVAIMGPSGSGKSTLLFTAAGLIRPTSGTVKFDGHDLLSMNDSRLSRLRRTEIGFVFQFGHLIKEMTATENVSMPMLITGVPRRQARQRAINMIDSFGLIDLADRFPDQLSGGEMQRIAVARAAVLRPRLILADEPTGALDSVAAVKVLDLLSMVTGDATGSSLVMVSHDASVASRCDRIVLVKDGETSDAAINTLR